MYQISESDYNEFLKYKQAKQAKEDKKLQKAKKLQDECENTFNEIQSLIITDENSDLIYERNKFIKKYIKNKKYGDDKYKLEKSKEFKDYLLKELDNRSKLPEKSEEIVYEEKSKEDNHDKYPEEDEDNEVLGRTIHYDLFDKDTYKRRESFNSYIKNKIDREIGNFAFQYISYLSYRDVKEDMYDIIENGSKEKDRYIYAIETFAAKMKEKYSSYFDQN